MSIKLRLRGSMLWLIVLCACCSVVSTAQNARQVVQKTFGSVVLLATEDANGQPLSIASGFFVLPNVIATNAHVIDGASSGYAKVLGHSERYKVIGVVGLDAKRDLALLSIASGGNSSLTVADSETALVGDEVFAVGNPRGLEGTVSQGIVSGIRHIGEESIIQITAPISPGSSGGPVLNSNAEVIGIATATFQGGQNLNFAVPSNYLRALINNMTNPIPLVPRRAGRKPDSILGALGGRNTEGVVAEAFSWQSNLSGLSIRDSEYSFTFRNRLQQSVSRIQCLILFIGVNGTPVDFAVIKYDEIIPPGLAKRITESRERVEMSKDIALYLSSSSYHILRSTLKVDASVRRLTKSIQFRVLDFQVIDSP